MVRTSSLVLLACLVASTGSVVSGGADLAAVARAAAPSVVSLFVVTDDGLAVPRGVGFVVRTGLVIAPHDAERSRGNVVVRSGAAVELVPAELVPERSGYLIDVYRARLRRVRPLTLSSRTRASSGDVVVVAPAWIRSDPAVGSFESDSSAWNGAATMRVACDLEPLAIGAPVLAKDGAVVGMTVALSRDGSKSCAAIPAVELAAALVGRAKRDTLGPGEYGGMPLGDDASSVGSKPESAPDDRGDTVAVDLTGLIGSDSSDHIEVPATRAEILKGPHPTYSEEARRNRVEGDVVVKALLGSNGVVKRAAVVRSLTDDLDKRALEAVKRLVFRPAKNARGEPVDSWATIRCNFALRVDPLDAIWLGSFEGASRRIEFLLHKDDGGGITGLVILETATGGQAALRVSGSRDSSEFRLAAQELLDGCAVTWSGTIESWDHIRARQSPGCGAAGEAGGETALSASMRTWTGLVPKRTP